MKAKEEMSLVVALASLRVAVSDLENEQKNVSEALTAIDLCTSLASISKEDLVDLFEICGPHRDSSAAVSKHLDHVEKVAMEELEKPVFVPIVLSKFDSPSDEVRARLRAWHLEYSGQGNRK